MRETSSAHKPARAPAHRPEFGAKLRVGFIVFGTLMAVEIIEYLAGTGLARGATPYLVVLALIGAWPIVQYFMHITQLWRREE